MSNNFHDVKNSLLTKKYKWLISGVAGFIGSNLLEELLTLNQSVIGIDNFSTGHKYNLKEVENSVTNEQWQNFTFIEGDIRKLADCEEACDGVDYVLHQAAIGSVPRSIENPIFTNENNIDGFLNMLVAARNAKVKKFIYAASSSTYGDHKSLPKVEDKIGRPLSPYAVTKYVNELYADVFSRIYDMNCIGLRYFNVFGRRQDPNGAYAAVIPKWIAGMIKGDDIYINGDGETSRDFCYIENVVQINLLAAICEKEGSENQVYNVAVGEKTTLNELYDYLNENLLPHYPHLKNKKAVYRNFRAGDVRHSLADISKAGNLLGYSPAYSAKEGLKIAMKWYMENADKSKQCA